MYSKIPRTVRIKKIVDDMNEYSSCDFNNKLIETCNKLKIRHYNKDLAIIHTCIHFDYIFGKNNNEKDHDDMFEDMYGAYYDENMNIHEDLTCNIISKFTKQKKVIFCWTDFIDYAAYRENDYANNELFTHSTLTIMSPMNNNKYFVYQFNPHGRCQMSYKGYTKYISRKRTKFFDCGEMLDTYAISKYCNAMNRCFKKYCDNKTELVYNSSKRHNYFGANLQSGDNFGCCFLFPFILFVDICKYYRESHILETNKKKLRFRSYKSLIDEQKFEKCVYIIISKYFKEISDMTLTFYSKKRDVQNYEDYEDSIESNLERNGNKYIKIIAYNSFITVNNN